MGSCRYLFQSIWDIYVRFVFFKKCPKYLPSKCMTDSTQVLPNILPRSQFGGMTVQKGCCMYVCLFWSGQRPVHFLLAYFQGKSTLLSRSFHPWAQLPPSVRLSQRTLLHTVWHDIIKSVNFFKIVLSRAFLSL